MARAIPAVKTWQVRMFDKHNKEIKRCYVQAPTKLLARLNHVHEHMGEAFRLGAYRVTYGVVKPKG